MSRLERKGTKVYYETSGKGPGLLLTHGFGATSRMWRTQSGVLDRQNEMIRWDLRGHGRSASPTNESLYGVNEAIADMLALLDESGQERAIIGGHSLGGYLSLAFYLKHPERVRALLLASTGPGYKSDAPRNEWNEMAVGLGRRLEDRGLDVLATMSREIDPTEHASAKGLGIAAREMLVQRDSQIIDSLSDIRVPTLVIVGEKDRGYLAASDYMAQKIPDVELVTIPNAGHAVNDHQPALFNAAAVKFIERIGE